MIKMLLIIVVLIIVLLVVATLIGKVVINLTFKRQSHRLRSQSKDISDKVFQYEQLEGLPAPVQQYFKHVLKEGQAYVSYVSFTHNGQFKTGLNKDWIKITGEHFATMEKPGFIWKGTTSMFTARDMYIEDQGRLVVALFSLYNIVDARGESYNQGELLRWLGESVLYPTNLLPCERLGWAPINDQQAKLTFTYKGMSMWFIVTFSQAGEIMQLESKRYMDKNNLETWVIKTTDYRTMDGINVPSRFEVMWRLVKGDFSYARFNIQQLTYNK